MCGGGGGIWPSLSNTASCSNLRSQCKAAGKSLSQDLGEVEADCKAAAALPPAAQRAAGRQPCCRVVVAAYLPSLLSLGTTACHDETRGAAPAAPGRRRRAGGCVAGSWVQERGRTLACLPAGARKLQQVAGEPAPGPALSGRAGFVRRRRAPPLPPTRPPASCRRGSCRQDAGASDCKPASGLPCSGCSDQPILAQQEAHAIPPLRSSGRDRRTLPPLALPPAPNACHRLPSARVAVPATMWTLSPTKPSAPRAAATSTRSVCKSGPSLAARGASSAAACAAARSLAARPGTASAASRAGATTSARA